MTDEILRVLHHHLPGYAVRSFSGPGQGSDHAAYEVNGELIVRVSKETDPARRSESTRREAALLAVVARLSTLPVPEPVFADVVPLVEVSQQRLHPRPERPRRL